MIIGDDYDTQGYRCRLWLFLNLENWDIICNCLSQSIMQSLKS